MAPSPEYLSPGRQRWLEPRGLRLEDGHLTYDRAATLSDAGELTEAGSSLDSSGRVMVELFMRLERATDKDVLAFAEEYGVLGLCRHGRIHTACQEVDPEDDDVDVSGPDNPADREALLDWRRWSHRVTAIVGTARSAARGETVAPWQLAEVLDYGTYGQEPLEDVGNTLETCRSAVAAACTRMLRDGDAGLVLRWDTRRDRPQLVVGAVVPDAGMFAGLALEVALVCSTAGRVYTCAGCGDVVTPRRKPAEGRKTWCDREECLKARQRYADERRRERARATHVERDGGRSHP